MKIFIEGGRAFQYRNWIERKAFVYNIVSVRKYLSVFTLVFWLYRCTSVNTKKSAFVCISKQHEIVVQKQQLFHYFLLYSIEFDMVYIKYSIQFFVIKKILARIMCRIFSRIQTAQTAKYSLLKIFFVRFSRNSFFNLKFFERNICCPFKISDIFIY